MNEKLLELAKEAGSKEGESWCKGYHCFTINQLEKFAELVQDNNVLDSEADSQLVPIEPTREMAKAFHNRIANACFQQAYKDMLEAAPVIKINDER